MQPLQKVRTVQCSRCYMWAEEVMPGPNPGMRNIKELSHAFYVIIWVELQHSS